jgi:hypothetical protein
MRLMYALRSTVGISAICMLVCSVLVPQSAAADAELHFSTGLRAMTDSNAGLDPASLGRSNSLGLRLGMELVSETTISRFEFSASGTLRIASGADDGTEGFVSPNVALGYTRTAANADLSLSAGLTEADLNDDDVTTLTTGPGTRRTSTASGALNWGTSTPLGFGVTAGVTDIGYRDALGLIGNRRTRVGANVRADLSQVLTLTLGVNQSRFDPDDVSAVRDTRSLDAGLLLSRPRGTLGLTLGLDDTEDGRRERLTLRQQIELPEEAGLSYSVGVTKGVNDDTVLTASLAYQRGFALGKLDVDISRDVTNNDTTDAETLQNRARIGWQQEVTPTASLSVAIDWAQSTVTATDLATSNTRLSATWSQALAQDWALDLGYVHRIRDEDGVGKSDSDQFFLELRRDFSTRF